MRGISALFYPPSSLLLLLLTTSPCAVATAIDEEAAWRQPPHGQLQRRHASIERRLATQTPVAVRKMGEDPNEMFFPEYWQFDANDTPGEPPVRLRRGSEQPWLTRIPRFQRKTATPANVTAPLEPLPPLLPHKSDGAMNSTFVRRHLLPRSLQKRGYKCPVGTHSCAAIGYEHSCCVQSERCIIIEDTGIGNVGCCPRGERCAGSVSTCDTANGYSSCPRSENKNGCCPPEFECTEIGCVKRVIQTTVTTIPVTVPQNPSTTRTSTRTVRVSTKTITRTEVQTPDSPSVVTVYTTKTTPTSTRTIGGGTVTTITRTGVVGHCPTGFYRCSANYLGGCCRVGRDCHSTECPARYSTSFIFNSVVTIVVHTGKGVTTVTLPGTTITGTTIDVTTPPSSVIPQGTPPPQPGEGLCADGWFLCPANIGGCCPSSYRCQQSCIATAPGVEPGKVLKAPINSGARSSGNVRFIVASFVTALGVILVIA